MDSQVGHDGGKDVPAAAAKPSPTRRLPVYVLRFAAIATTLIAAIIMGVAKQTKTINVELAATLPPLPVTLTAKSSQSSAFVYFVVVNAIACAYSALSLGTSVIYKSKRGMTLLLSIVDVAVMALLLSGNGAAMAIGVVGLNGNKHVGWNKVCNVYGKFCTNVLVSISFSLLGSVAYFIILVLTLVGLHRRSI